MELSELIQQAQTEMERGDYKSAARVCEHIIEHLPSCFTAHRLLGECRLELHDVDAAIAQFQMALNFDPMSVVVRLGMGVAAEERHDVEAAYACYLHCWEINPGLEQVRDRLVGLRRALGVDPRLHLTRAGLASVHLRAGRYDRAISELRHLVEAEPEGRRARSALVEALWRNGEDAAAATLCRVGLDQASENGRYLAVLAEIEHRLKTTTAPATIARLHAVDPLGEIATLMAEWRPDRDVSALFADAVALPELAPVVEAMPFKLLSPEVASAPVADAVSEARIEEPVAAVGVARGVAGLDSSIQPFVWDEAPAARQTVDEAPSGWDDWRNPAPGERPSAIELVDSPAANSGSVKANEPTPFVTNDGLLDLTVGWDDLDQALADATPPAVADDRFADLMAELTVDGIAPFDAVDEPVDESAWEPLFAADCEPDVQAAEIEAVVQPIAAGPVVEMAAVESAPPQAVDIRAEIETPAELVLAGAVTKEAAPVEEDDFAVLEPFAFEELAVSSDRPFESGFDFSDLDAAVMAPSRPERVSMLLDRPGPAVAAALAETFPDEVDERESAFAGFAVKAPGSEVASEPPASIFHVLRASKSRSGLRPKAPISQRTPTPVFHVEHSAPAPTPVAERAQDARGFSIDRDELMTLRIRLIEEEHSAGDIARTLEAKLGAGSSDPLAARVLGEAYLRLGKSDQAAAQFRQAMLARSVSRAASPGGAAR